MKNNELEPIQQIGIAAVLVGLDMFCNNGKITAGICKAVVGDIHKRLENGEFDEK